MSEPANFIMRTPLSEEFKLNEFNPCVGNILLSESDRDRVWYTRERLDRACIEAAIIRFQPKGTAQRTFQGLWGFPLLVTRDKSEAEIFLARYGNAP